jgi:hypothetical protein
VAPPPPSQVFVSLENPYAVPPVCDIVVVKLPVALVVALPLIVCVCDGILVVVKVTLDAPPVVDVPLVVLERPCKKFDCKFGVTTLFPLFVVIPNVVFNIAANDAN